MATDNPGWLEKPENKRRIRLLLYGLCTGLVLVDFVAHRHISTALERVPAFYALYGFAALVGVVLAAKVLRRLVKRDEAYYDR
jgi:hypothetical protein